MENKKIICDFRRLSEDDMPLAGGKGANLGELTHAKMPVPPGFVITTVAYDRFINQSQLAEVIVINLKDKNNDGSRIKEAFTKAPIPPDVEKALLGAYQKLGKGPVAVRSSATAEDLPGAAFAGQYETYLNIVGGKELLDALRRTWASLWTDRAIAYRARLKIDHKKVKIAVVVQRMIDAEFAGVMFTANPVTGNREETVIDANPGLGEAVVSGAVTPDHFVLKHSWLGWRLREKKAGRREVIIKSKKGGGTERIEKHGADYKLPQNVLVELSKLGAKIEKHFGVPQDIEWVWDRERIFIVQSRPITALPESPPNPSRITRMLSAIMAEMFPIRPYPLDAMMIDHLIDGFVKQALRFFGWSFASAESLFPKEKGVPSHFSGHLLIRPRIGLLLMPLRLVWSAIRYSPLHWRDDPLILELVETVRRLEKQDIANLSLKELVQQVEKARNVVFRIVVDLRMRYIPRVLLAMGFLRVMLLLTGRGKLWSALLFLGLESKVIEMNRALEDLAHKIRQDPTLASIFKRNETKVLFQALERSKEGEVFLKHLHTFLDEYGHREAGATFFISQPTWKESPDVALGILKTLALTAPEAKTKNVSWREARDDILENPLFKVILLRSLFLASLKNARRFYELREDTRFYWMMIVPVIRQRFLELGGRLCEVGILDEKEEVWWLTFDELKEIAINFPPSSGFAHNLRTVISERKFIYDKLKNIRFVDPRLFQVSKRTEGALVVGTPGSPGLAEGIARVIKGSSEFSKLRSGEVLVAPYTNPAWTPLFQRAVAVVVDSGSVISHAAIVAREYGIPAVMGTVDGTKKIKDGDQIRVDGTNGQIFTSKK